MNEIGWPQWAVVIFLFGLMCIYAFFLARNVYQMMLRLSKKVDLSVYEKWGMKQDLLWPLSGQWFIVWATVTVIFAATTFVIALYSTLLITDVSSIGGGQFYDTFTFFFFGFLIGIAIESQRFQEAKQKVERLEGLREIYHERFSRSELLSVYESLRHSPPLFWREYTQLPDDQVNHETNGKYRERAIPYSYSQSGSQNRMMIIVAVLTLVVSVIAAIFAIEEFLS